MSSWYLLLSTTRSDATLTLVSLGKDQFRCQCRRLPRRNSRRFCQKVSWQLDHQQFSAWVQQSRRDQSENKQVLRYSVWLSTSCWDTDCSLTHWNFCTVHNNSCYFMTLSKQTINSTVLSQHCNVCHRMKLFSTDARCTHRGLLTFESLELVLNLQSRHISMFHTSVLLFWLNGDNDDMLQHKISSNRDKNKQNYETIEMYRYASHGSRCTVQPPRFGVAPITAKRDVIHKTEST